ncbi:MAG: threonine--tRNA ligase, partial [Oscillospiraceae bacterium]|nr:threonine--tRNA ligase [Oscillospiraceae bacterium]
MVKVTLKDGKVIEVAKGTSYAEIVKSISMKLYKDACVVKANGDLHDLRDAADEDVTLEVLTFDDKDGKKAFWHTSSHILAQAVLKFIPDAKLTIGPSIDNGFYYDIDTDVVIDDAMIEKLEKEMKEIAKKDLALSRFDLPKAEALARYTDNEFKTELINELPEDAVISFYQQGEEFCDLCAGPHLMTTGKIGAFKIMSVAGAYWRGSSDNKMLKRIYGISFPKAKQLEEYLNLLEEAKKRDHRKLGKELRLFELIEEGPGFPFFLPKGMIVYNTLLDYWREIHTREGYVEIATPTIMNRHLWETSGHWYHYKENMYTTIIDDQDFAIKPMNCPGGMLVYKMEPRSYRDLPIRMGEIGLVHRHELSGALNGLMRVRCFHQDDAHIFMTKDQIQDEIKNVVSLFDEVYKLFGLTFHVELSTRPEDSMGSDEDWEIATEGLRGALDSIGLDYVVNEGDGAFYGPKIDFHLNDAIGRTWQCGTIQLDMQLPERFELEYTGADGQKHRPVMIHRVVYGSIERFIGILIEHFAGAFPTWLAPVQAVVIPVSEAHKEYAHEVLAKLKAAGVRAECDDRNEKMGYRIRENQLNKVPYRLVVGDKEAQSGEVAP